jgi:hypothetical protein
MFGHPSLSSSIHWFWGLFFLLLQSVGYSAVQNTPPSYWQLHVHYSMSVMLDTANHHLSGSQTLTIKNTSPDTLNELYYHLYYNAFQPGSAMDVRSRSLPDPDRRVGSRIQKLSPDQIGYQRIVAVSQDRNPIASFSISGTVMHLPLKKPILPGQETSIELQFQAQIPVQIRRTGRHNAEGIDFSMTQWYPKLAVYDANGWNTDPYVAREFYGNFGTFEVNLKVPQNQVVAATGILLNPEEVGHGYSALSKPVKGWLTWKFKAENVHDFAWAADPDYKHDTLRVPKGPLLRFFYQSDSTLANWQALKPYCQQLFERMSATFGPYPYPVFSFVQGGDGGMEYPMLTLITARGNLDGLISVSFHEAIHNWFYGLWGFDEGKYPWMDEGFTQYATDYMLHQIRKEEHPRKSIIATYKMLLAMPNRQPLSTHADWYSTNRAYGLSSYIGGAAFLEHLTYLLGEERMPQFWRNFYRDWKFKHPNPENLIRTAEKVGNMELDWFYREFILSTHTIDYAVDSVWKSKEGIAIRLANRGSFPMPIRLRIDLKNGNAQNILIPLDVQRLHSNLSADQKTLSTIAPLSPWPWVDSTYTFELPIGFQNVQSVTIDPDGYLADIDLENNVKFLP